MVLTMSFDGTEISGRAFVVSPTSTELAWKEILNSIDEYFRASVAVALGVGSFFWSKVNISPCLEVAETQRYYRQRHRRRKDW